MRQRDTTEFAIRRVFADDLTPEMHAACMDVVYKDVMANTRGATPGLAMSASYRNPYHDFDTLQRSLNDPNKANMYIGYSQLTWNKRKPQKC